MSENEIRLECLKLVFMQRRWAALEDIIEVAQELESYVFGNPDVASIPGKAYEFPPTSLTAGFPEN